MTATVETISPRWAGLCIVAAPGPSLKPEVAAACEGQRVLAVGDAWRRLPWAEVLYHCDAKWWDYHKGCQDFAGEKWSSHHPSHTPKIVAAEKYGLRLVAGDDKPGFSLSPRLIHFGKTSGFQAINLAILFGGNPIVLVGFDMRGYTHFFGDHPKEINRGTDLARFVPVFEQAAKLLPPEIKILNATKDSAIRCFPSVDLADVLMREAA